MVVLFLISGVKQNPPLKLMFCFNMNVTDSKDQTMPVCYYLCWAISYWMLKIISLLNCVVVWTWNVLQNLMCLSAWSPWWCCLGKVVEALGVGALLEEVGQWNGPWFLSSLAPLPVHCLFPGGRHNVTLRPITPWCHITSIMINFSLLNSKRNKPFLLKLLFVSYLVTVTEKINKKVTNI